MIVSAPDRTEAAEFYFTYIGKVPGSDVLAVLETQLAEVMPILRSVSEEKSLHRYALDKWSMREVVNHVNDAERLFSFRAFWFSRGMAEPLPSFDENAAAAAAAADERSWQSHLDELESLRATTLALFRNLPDEAWRRRGVASGSPISVRALAYICAGHVTHHVGVLQDRYLRRAGFRFGRSRAHLSAWSHSSTSSGP